MVHLCFNMNKYTNHVFKLLYYPKNISCVPFSSRRWERFFFLLKCQTPRKFSRSSLHKWDQTRYFFTSFWVVMGVNLHKGITPFTSPLVHRNGLINLHDRKITPLTSLSVLMSIWSCILHDELWRSSFRLSLLSVTTSQLLAYSGYFFGK